MLGYSGGLASVTLGKAVADSLAGALLQVPTPLKESLAKELSDAALGSLGGQAKAQLGIFDSPTFARAIAPTFEFGELVPEFKELIASIQLQTKPLIEIGKLGNFPKIDVGKVGSFGPPPAGVPTATEPEDLAQEFPITAGKAEIIFEEQAAAGLRALPLATRRKLAVQVGTTAVAAFNVAIAAQGSQVDLALALLVFSLALYALYAFIKDDL